jgi:Fe-S oxidoreductase
VSNWLVRSEPLRRLQERLLGIDRRRLPPAFARRTLFRQFVDTLGTTPEGVPDVLLFPDTFTNYYEPEIGMAALAWLRATGASPLVGLPRARFGPPVADDEWPNQLVCCGRPAISNGLLDRAVRLARHNVRCLHPWAAAGRPILACEPSCILTIRDDYPALLRGDERRRAETVAGACRPFEEFAEEILASRERERPEGFPVLRSLTLPARRILVQAHCHQRALVGVQPTLRLLRRIPGAEVIDLDAGCCGMAGSFGYEKEHYEISRLVGEQRLFPALRQADADTVIVAPGFSCRLQIRHFTGRAALHPAELLAGLLQA